jgi:hypothetical protein
MKSWRGILLIRIKKPSLKDRLFVEIAEIALDKILLLYVKWIRLQVGKNFSN